MQKVNEKKETKLETIVRLLKELTDDERIDMFTKHFCRYCGNQCLPCSCTRDE